MDSAFNAKNNKRIKKINLSRNEKSGSFLLSKGKRQNIFFANDSCLYFNCDDRKTAELVEFRTKNKMLDSLNRRAMQEHNKIKAKYSDYLYYQYRIFAKRFDNYQKNVTVKKYEFFLSRFSILRLWNASILVAIIIGMISMSFIYRYLGLGVSAKDAAPKEIAGAYTETINKNEWTSEKEDIYLAEIAGYLKAEADKDFNIRAKELVKGYPIAEMMPYILKKDPKVAAFYIAIAKKESNWGKRVPVLKGKDCYNYVGYRGKTEELGSGGHSCFKNREIAVDITAKRIEELVENYSRDTAEKMVVWKCGRSCAATGGQAAADKWISDVDMILERLNEER
ncbi:MAG: hypothetical protein WC682_02050 [Parcubacteria group bacterium]|jgi:hypothetical protein